MSLEYHIEQMRRLRGWTNVRVTEKIWTSTEWTVNPLLPDMGDFLIVEFQAFLPATAPPTGTWFFSSGNNNGVSYDRASARVWSNGTDSSLTSDMVTTHFKELRYKPQSPEPTAYTWIRILMLRGE